MSDFALIRTADQWRRARHEDTALDPRVGEVSLAWTTPEAEPGAASVYDPAGLAFDSLCRVYHARPAQGQVDRVRWRSDQAFADASERPEPVPLFRAAPATSGGFHAVDAASPLRTPTALAVDGCDRLYVVESGARRVLIYDLYDDRLLRRVPLAAPRGAPVDVAAGAHDVWLLLDGPAALMRLDARSGLAEVDVDVPPAVRAARWSALAVSPSGERWLLLDAGEDGARVVSLERAARPPIAVPGATDVAFEGDDVLVVARAPGVAFRRFRVTDGRHVEVQPGSAFGYDGRGIVRTPDGRIAYWSDRGLMVSVPARVRYAPRGRVYAFRLDSGAFQTRWGRMFVEACVPEGTELVAYTLTADENPPEPPVAPAPPQNADGLPVHRADLTPPLPPQYFRQRIEEGAEVPQTFHRRDGGREIAWSPNLPGDRDATYEAPVDQPPGRFLWVVIELRGNERRTPRVRALRVEHPAHAWLDLLPKTFSRDEAAAAFLLRYLAPLAGTLQELDDRASLRRALLDARSAPDELLPWLASFLGLALDARWPIARRRALVREVARLFRLRGTVWGLRRFLELCTDRPVILVEHFRLRGLGGSVGVAGAAPTSRAILGGGFRVGGGLDRAEAVTATPGAAQAADRAAHRFTVIVQGRLTDDERAMVDLVLATHRPAHTVFELCTAEAGIRVGLGLRVGLSAIVGCTGGFAPTVLDQVALDRGALLGRAGSGVHLGAATLGRDTRVG